MFRLATNNASSQGTDVGRDVARDVKSLDRSARKIVLQANAQREYQVTLADLRPSCPMAQMPLWNSHPHVYLPIADTAWAMCPYCAAEYRLHGERIGSMSLDGTTRM
jgi:uncharacterized Zn-finger protein